MEEDELNGAIRSKVHHYTLPIMMKQKNSELVVLFIRRDFGVVLNALYNEEGEIVYAVGDLEEWKEPVDDPSWERVNSLLLTQ
jgi:hypothetical protein